MTGRLKKTMRFLWKFLYRTLLFLVVAIALGVGGLFWWLHEKPMNLAFLMPKVQEYLLKENSALKLNVDSVYLSAEMRRGGLFHIQIKNMELLGKDEALILDLPTVELSYGILSLITLNYMPKSVFIDEPLLQLTLTKDEKLLLQGQSQDALEDLSNMPEEKPIETSAEAPKVVIEAPVETVKSESMAHKALVIGDIHHAIEKILKIRRFVLHHASMVIDDEKMHRRIIVPQMNLILKRRRFTQYEIDADMQVRMQRDLMSFKTNAVYDLLAQTIEFDIFFDKFNLSRVGRVVPLLTGMKVSLQGEINGSLDIAERRKHWRHAFKSLDFTVKTTQKGIVQLPEPLNTVYPVASLTATGSFSPNLTALKIQPVQAALTTGLKADVDITVSNIGDFLDENNFDLVKTTLNARINNIPMKEVPAVWPSYLGPDAHKWVQDNLKTGTATTALFTLYFAGATIADLVGDVDFKETTVDYLSPMKPVKNAGGKVMLYPDRVEIFADRGEIDHIRLNAANVYLTDLVENAVSRAKIELDVSGPATEILALIDEKPLQLLAGFGVKPQQITGDVKGQATLSFPLIENLTPQDVIVDVKASASQASFETPDKKISVQKGAAGVVVNNDGLALKGTGVYENIPVSFQWEEFFMPTNKNPVKSIYSVEGTVSDLFIKPYFEDISDYLIGNIDGRLVYRQHKDKTAKVLLSGDLTQTEVMLYPVAYTKVKGVPATADAEVQLTSKGAFESVRFHLSADKKAMDISGLIRQSGDKTSVVLDKVKAPGTDFSAQFSINNKKDIQLKMKGKSWLMTELKNMPYFKKHLMQSTPNEPKSSIVNIQTPPPAANIDVAMETITLNAKAPLKKVAVKAKRTGYKWQNLFIFARGNDALSISLSPAGGRLEGVANDMGDLLNRLNFSSEFSGGRVTLTAAQNESGLINGEVKVKDMDFKNPGFIMQALTILGIVDAVRGKDLSFNHGSIPFTLSPRFSLTIQDGVLYGTSLGITFTGTASLEALKMSGSVIPAYAVNSLPGRIPLIGGLFRTVPNGGLMGVMYELTGTPGMPVVTFNPLSSIAPGILSRLFQ